MLAIAANLALQSGLVTEVDFSDNEDYYRSVADRLFSRLKVLSDKHPDSDVCLIAGGEVSCPVSGKGTGGRNQEFGLYCATKIREISPGPEVAILSAGTDGIDGNSNAAGAVVDNDTIIRQGSAGLKARDFLERNDSYHYFENYDGLIVTGPTGTNVRDLRLFLIRRSTFS
ncbi:MAG TPA: MOFRL family protein [Blastocatellia bacterium]|nr:MOFRL family protein [Blastocatellia bacterium]